MIRAEWLGPAAQRGYTSLSACSKWSIHIIMIMIIILLLINIKRELTLCDRAGDDICTQQLNKNIVAMFWLLSSNNNNNNNNSSNNHNHNRTKHYTQLTAKLHHTLQHFFCSNSIFYSYFNIDIDCMLWLDSAAPTSLDTNLLNGLKQICKCFTARRL